MAGMAGVMQELQRAEMERVRTVNALKQLEKHRAAGAVGVVSVELEGMQEQEQGEGRQGQVALEPAEQVLAKSNPVRVRRAGQGPAEFGVKSVQETLIVISVTTPPAKQPMHAALLVQELADETVFRSELTLAQERPTLQTARLAAEEGVLVGGSGDEMGATVQVSARFSRIATEKERLDGVKQELEQRMTRLRQQMQQGSKQQGGDSSSPSKQKKAGAAAPAFELDDDEEDDEDMDDEEKTLSQRVQEAVTQSQAVVLGAAAYMATEGRAYVFFAAATVLLHLYGDAAQV